MSAIALYDFGHDRDVTRAAGNDCFLSYRPSLHRFGLLFRLIANWRNFGREDTLPAILRWNGGISQETWLRKRARVDIVDEVDETRAVGVVVVVHRHVAAGGADDGAAIGEGGSHPFHVPWVHGVMFSADDEGGYGDLVQFGSAVPFEELATKTELTGTL